jgi:hypothetical protein
MRGLWFFRGDEIMADETLLEEENSPSQEDLPFVEWNEFLESVPPNVECRVR